MATTRKTAIKTAVTATKTAALAGAAKTDALNLSKPRRPGVTTAAQKAEAIAKEKTAKPAKKTPLLGADPKGVPGKSAKAVTLAEAISTVAAAGKKPMLTKPALPRTKNAKALDKIVANKKVAKVDKRRETPQIKIGKVVIERPARKKSDAFDSVPTISVKSGADTIKVFSKLPKGFSWLTDNGTSTKDTLMVYNKHGVHIADVRIERK
jgi:hypothetical protein